MTDKEITTTHNDTIITPSVEIDDVPANAWKYSDVLGDGKANSVPKWRKLPKINIFNQASSPDTKMACSRFALAHISNVQNAFQYDSLRFQVDPSILWKHYTLENPMAKDVGATLMSAIKQFKKVHLISGYLVCRTKEEVMDAINNGRYIYTGSRNGDWADIKTTKLYKKGSVPCPHITSYFAYNTKYIVGINSYGESDGPFAVTWEDFMSPEFMTRLAICDATDNEVLAQYRWNNIK
jgi:hypothetical protein